MLLTTSAMAAERERSLVDFFLPMPTQSPLASEGIWGAENVLPRDTTNGLEDPTLKEWCYWDGSIVRSDDGRYHIYASRWPQSVAHSVGWKANSSAMHAVSDNIMGPYKDLGLIWPEWRVEAEEASFNGIGHNVSGFRMHDGRYGVVSSEVTPGVIFASDSPDGPFEYLGEIKYEANGFELGLARYGKAPYHMSNVRVLPRPDGRYMIVGRSTATLISENGVLGPYKIMSGRVYAKYPELPQEKNEDPTVWYSGGMYHIVYNHWPSKTSHHFTSKDGIEDWVYRGIAFKKDEIDIFRYSDGTINKWEYIERPCAYVGEDGHVSHFIFSVIDTGKGGDRADDNHGSKIVVVPFDGKAFDKYMNSLE